MLAFLPALGAAATFGIMYFYAKCLLRDLKIFYNPVIIAGLVFLKIIYFWRIYGCVGAFSC